MDACYRYKFFVVSAVNMQTCLNWYKNYHNLTEKRIYSCSNKNNVVNYRYIYFYRAD